MLLRTGPLRCCLAHSRYRATGGGLGEPESPVIIGIDGLVVFSAMTILVTGGAGFFGSATVERLRAQGEHVVVLDDLVHGHRGALDGEVPLYQGRVGDRSLVSRMASEHKVEECIHFATLTSVGEFVADSENTSRTTSNRASHGSLPACGALFFRPPPPSTGSRTRFPFPNRARNGR
jgi:hypothetical protein